MLKAHFSKTNRHIFYKAFEGVSSGFSLIELMIVVGIVGLLATLAFPRLSQFQQKAKMAEAATMLQYLSTLEKSYLLENNHYLAMGDVGANLDRASGGNQCNPTGNAKLLGFDIHPCTADGPTPRFAYSVISNNATDFMASGRTGMWDANRICPGNRPFSISIHMSQDLYFYRGPGLDPTQATTNTGFPNVGAVCPI